MIDRRTLLLGATAGAAGVTGGFGLVAQAQERTIDIVARKFEFVPAEIALKRGQPVTLRFTAPEVTMGINLADFAQRADIVPGQVATMRFTPDKAGRFTFVCDIFCGTGHEDMSGVVVVA